MITIISGTNRPGSNSLSIARHYQQLLQSLGMETALVDLSLLPDTFTAATSLYESANRHEQFEHLSRYISEGSKFAVVVPEYNGSFPGVLKAFIDGLEYPASFRNKKVGLIGLSSGTQGGLLAMSHLTDVFHYLGAEVLSMKPRLLTIKTHMAEGALINANYEQLLLQHAERLIAF